MATNIKGRDIVKAIKAKGKVEKTNITFRMSKDLIERFKTICEKQDVSANEVAENMIQQFVSDFK